MSGKRVAVIGGGIAGISAAFALHKTHDAHLLEASDRLGGHAYPARIVENDCEFDVDTAFLIFNSHSYPLFHSFLRQLGVDQRVARADMSIGVWQRDRGLLYAVDASLGELFAQASNLLNPRFYKLFSEIRRFRTLSQLSETENDESLRSFLTRKGFSEDFTNAFALPLGAAVWSLPRGRILDFPAAFYFNYFSNHKLLKEQQGACWQTLRGSSRVYLDAFTQKFEGRIHLRRPVVTIKKVPHGAIVVDALGQQERYDFVIVATHADDALKLLSAPSADERGLLGSWSYQSCLTVLHSDPSVFPKVRGTWPSWCIESHQDALLTEELTVTYHLNRVQGLKAKRPYFMTLGDVAVKESTILRRARFKHPIFAMDNRKKQVRLQTLNTGRVLYCGSYFGAGFHEDAIRSALAVASDVQKNTAHRWSLA